ncbi:hypothetical protein BKA64DRAFT_760350 [Cadophora sp. MPI-SDFR-AT-0126]|nr:hypothetical protein BKA64DRAFT_760350 [Leotiomycetes sp. MPI-SDFR-AT-0126]
MAAVRRNGSKRNMSCYWTAGTQNADTVGEVLEGSQGVMSVVLACSDRGPQTETQTPIPASVRSIRPTPPNASSAGSPNSTGRPSIQPFATPTSLPSQASRTSKLATGTPSPPDQNAKSNATILHLSVVSTAISRTIPEISMTSTAPGVLISLPNLSESSYLALSASIPFAPLLASQISSEQTLKHSPSSISVPLGISAGDSNSELDSSSSKVPSNKASSHASLIIGGVICGVILLAFLLTIYFCRRMRRKQHRRSMGYMSTASMYKPWKKREVERKNTIANLEGLLDLDRDRHKGEGLGRGQAKPKRDRAVHFHSQVSAFAYEGKGAAAIWRPLTMPDPTFAPLRANRSSSLYSGSLMDGFDFFPETPQRIRARSALLPSTKFGLQDGKDATQDPFLTPSEILRNKHRDGNGQLKSTAKTSPPRSDIYIARPYSIFDIADDELKSSERDSAISGLSKFEDMHPLSPSALTQSSRSRYQPGSRSISRSRPGPMSRSRASTPALSPSRSETPPPSPSQFSGVSSNSSSTPTKVERALATVRDLDKDVTLSLDVEQEYGYRLRELGARRADFNTQVGERKVNVVGSKLRNEAVMIVSERDLGNGNQSDDPDVGGGRGGLEEWEEREMERRRQEREQPKVRVYTGRIKPGMGVQKRGGGAIGVQRSHRSG